MYLPLKLMVLASANVQVSKLRFFSYLMADLSFSWTRNGSHFDVESDSKVLMRPSSGTLVIDISGEKAQAYEGTYQCTAHNEHGTAVSDNFVIRQSSMTCFTDVLPINIVIFIFSPSICF